jgi:hypothetical protein
VTATMPETEEDRESVYGLPLPPCDMSDPAQVETWFEPGTASLGEHIRSAVKSNCAEIIRAEYAERNEKISEARIDDLSKTHEAYYAVLRDLIVGRTERNRNRIASLRNGA